MQVIVILKSQFVDLSNINQPLMSQERQTEGGGWGGRESKKEITKH